MHSCRKCVEDNNGIVHLCKVGVYKTMSYAETRKSRKLWSEQANAKQERARMQEAEPRPLEDPDPYMKITIERKATNEKAVFECFEGDSISNYRVYCNDKYFGIHSITSLMASIRKSLPRFRRM